MIYLFLSILFNSLLFVIFKVFKRFEVNTLHAIITNYFTAATLGFLLLEKPTTVQETVTVPWLGFSIFLGFNFISIFNILASTTQKMGVSVASVVSKMSLVIPVVVAFIIYKEPVTLIKIAGILLALLAVYFTAKKDHTNVNIDKKLIYLPILLFVGSGTLDTVLKYTNNYYLADDELDHFSAVTFLCAGSYGLLFLFYQLIQGNLRYTFKSFVAGVCLGIPNYFSLYYLVKAIDLPNLDSSIIFPINNVGVVVFSSLIGLLLFKEHLSYKNWTGIAIAVMAILLMSVF